MSDVKLTPEQRNIIYGDSVSSTFPKGLKVHVTGAFQLTEAGRLATKGDVVDVDHMLRIEKWIKGGRSGPQPT